MATRIFLDNTLQLQLLKQLEQKLKVKQPTDWYKHKPNDLIKKDTRAVTLLKHYDNSLPKLLSSLYPEVEWETTRYLEYSLSKINKKPTRFPQLSTNLTWQDQLQQLEQKIGITKPEDWYQITNSVVI